MNSTALFHPSRTLDVERVVSLLEAGGPISRVLKNFETRKEQIEMLKKLVEAFNKGAVALIEAGTGTGKSIAYLLPALLYASLYGERVVISTHTISLQEQILKKDIPLLMNALGIQVKVMLVKGMGNYPCLRKLSEAEHEKLFLAPSEREMLDKIHALAKAEKSRSEFPFQPTAQMWELTGAEHESCDGSACSFNSECSYMNARRSAQEARILIVNHHLLFADLAARAEAQNYANPAILPAYGRLVIDEAHNLEEIATEYFSTKLSRLDILKTLSRLSSEKQGAKEQGRLPQLKEKVQSLSDATIGTPLSKLLTLDLPARRRDLLQFLTQLFHSLDQVQEGIAPGLEEKKIRLRQGHFDLKHWTGEVQPQARRARDALMHYAQDLEGIEPLMNEEGSNRLLEQTKTTLLEIKSLAKKIRGAAEVLEKLVEHPPTSQEIRWIESRFSKHGLNVSLVQASLDISKLLLQRLFEPLNTVALVSATLTARGSFEYLKERVGLSELPERLLIELSVDSPFNYEEQALFIVPKDMPDPSSSAFMPAAVKLILDAVEASHGNAFILFTSHQTMKAFYEELENTLREKRFHPLCQGHESTSALLKKFVATDRSVLFGTDSFWEGVDVAGEALRLVVIAKLPFKVPSDPLIEARSEALLTKGKSPFYHLLLPQAAIKLKQGFGRLIRKKNDRGCILCLDGRVMGKGYGKYFLSSLPKCPLVWTPAEEIKKVMTDFFRKTYHLTTCKS